MQGQIICVSLPCAIGCVKFVMHRVCDVSIKMNLLLFYRAVFWQNSSVGSIAHQFEHWNGGHVDCTVHFGTIHKEEDWR